MLSESCKATILNSLHIGEGPMILQMKLECVDLEIQKKPSLYNIKIFVNSVSVNYAPCKKINVVICLKINVHL